MTDFLPREVREGLEAARKCERRKSARMRIEVGGQSFTILRYWDEGFALDVEDAPHLRGYGDLYDGARHVGQCLIVASAEEGDEMVFEFKRNTPAAERPPVDFARDEPKTAGALPPPVD